MWARAFGLLGIVVLSVFIGYVIGSKSTQLEVVIVPRPLPPKVVEVEVPVEVVKEVEVIKEVELVKEVPIELRHFESVQELKEWLQQVGRPVRLKADSEGIIRFEGVCDDVAMYLQDRAIEDGYNLSIDIMSRDEYRKWYGEWPDEGKLHAVNSAIIGNETWFIDFLNDKVWLGGYLDEPK